MSQELIKRLLKNREVRIAVGDKVYIGRRPSDLDLVNLARERKTTHELSRDFVTGWEKVTENDVVGGGGTSDAEFSVELWAYFYGDHPELWGPISDGLMEAYKAHAGHLKATEKN